MVPGLRFEAEGDMGCRVVEVAQVLDVVAVVAFRIEWTGAFEVRWHVVAAVAMERGHPLQRLHGLEVALLARAGATGLYEFACRIVPAECRIRRPWAGGVGAIPVVADAAGGG